MPLKVMLTGCKGQLGSELKKILDAGRSGLGRINAEFDGANITACDRKTLDITNRAAVFELVKNERPDVIFNCAAYTDVDGCEKNKDAALRANALGPSYIAQAAERAGARLVQVSTDYVFGGSAGPYSEYDATSPINAYGATKLLGESYVRDFCGRYYIVRTAWLYGGGRNFVNAVLKRAREHGKLRVVTDSRGSPTDVSELAHVLLDIAASGAYGVYHCAGNGECSRYEFARELIKLSGVKAEVLPCASSELDSAARRPANSALDCAMLRTMGIKTRPWRQALECHIKSRNEAGI